MNDARPLVLKPFDEEVQAQADLLRLRQEIRALEAERDAIRDAARREGLELGRAVESERASLRAAAERDLLRLALLVAGKVTKAAVLAGRPVAEQNLRRAIELTARRQELRVFLNPQDVARIEEFLPELRREFSDVQAVALEADASVGRGGVVVRSREGSVDATIAAQLEEIERGLLG
jgi:flagellar assembly protein FliH